MIQFKSSDPTYPYLGSTQPHKSYKSENIKKAMQSSKGYHGTPKVMLEDQSVGHTTNIEKYPSPCTSAV
jgi:glutaredoxin